MRIKLLLIVLSFYSICNGQQDESYDYVLSLEPK